MNDFRLESLLVGAAPREYSARGAFTENVMKRLKADTLFEENAHPKLAHKGLAGIFAWLKTMHGVWLLVAIVAGLLVLSGVVYASVRFAPDFIHIFDKRLDSRGKIEYSVPNFTACQQAGYIPIDTFEVRPDAGLSDEEVNKILQAKCELSTMDKFANDTWPTQGQHAHWQDGDTITYARPDVLGTVKAIDKHGVTLSYGGGQVQTFKAPTGSELQAYSRDQRTTLARIKPGDAVFTIARVSERYHPGPHNGNPKTLGAIAVVKLSLPIRYYFELQSYIIDVEKCSGNPSEHCISGNTGIGIDVFPREGGEGAKNPDARPPSKTLMMRSIDGTVLGISQNEFTIKSSSGATYTVLLPKAVLDHYNASDALQYTGLTPDNSRVTVHAGSFVNILYQQEPGDDAKHIAKPDIFRIELLTDISPKKSAANEPKNVAAPYFIVAS